MANEISSQRAASRRYVQSERLRARMEQSITRAARVIHAEQVAAWARGEIEAYPSTLRSRVIAEQEYAVLMRGLASLIEVEPSQFREDARSQE